MNIPPPDEPEHDAMLRAALRHAPDRDARPSEAVSAQILRRAREAAAEPVATSNRGVWPTLRRWLDALARPAPAAAFASLMLATVIGVMWQGGPPPERADATDPKAGALPSVAREASAVTAAEAQAEGASRAGAADAAGSLAERAARSPAPAAAPAPRPPNRSAPPATEARAKAATAPAPSAEAPPLAAPAAPTTGARDEARPAAAPEAPAPARRSEAGAPHAPGRPHGQAAEADAVEPREGESASPAALTGRTGETRARSEPGDSARRPLAAPTRTLIDPTAGWAGAQASQRTALDELRFRAAGRWSRAPMADMPPSSEVERADGRPLGRLAITDDAVWWQPDGEAAWAWRAPLEPAVAADLRRRLAVSPER